MFTHSSLFSKGAVSIAVSILFAVIAAHARAATDQSNNAFNPAIGLVLNGTYGQFSRDPNHYVLSGLPLAADADPGTRGFSAGESELSVSANVDPDWYAFFTYSMVGDQASVENAYVQSTSLGHGLTVKAGRFFSGIGYLNEHHSHTWDFADTALPYRAFLDTQYGDDGIQVRWLAPLPIFVELGAELFRGDAFPAGGSANKGRGTWSAFVHCGGDLDASNSWLTGLSYLSAKANQRETGNSTNPDLFSGKSKLLIADVVWKWAPNGNPYRHNFKLQAEYLRGDDNGDFTPAGGSPLVYKATPSGWYAQAVYQFIPRWRVGLRHDQLNSDSPGAAFAATALDNRGHNPKRDSVMVDFTNSEFSRLRLQYNHDQSGPKTDQQWFLQYIMSIGAHGAHIF